MKWAPYESGKPSECEFRTYEKPIKGYEMEMTYIEALNSGQIKFLKLLKNMKLIGE